MADFDSYKVLDSGNQEKLEQYGAYTIIRPSPGAIWQKSAPSLWAKADARYERFSDGKGKWTYNNSIPEAWKIEVSNLQFEIRKTNFGHLGIFPEQKKNWLKLQELISSKGESEFRVLNLFAYTGGSTLACAKSGASVVHLDASKTTVQWAKDNAELNDVQNSIRFIVDDVKSFVKREIRRGSQYEGIILDPPTYGRGSKNQVWKIEDDLGPLLDDLKQLFSDRLSFVLLSCHTPSFTQGVLENCLRQRLPGNFMFHSEEMLLDGDGLPVPLGACSWAIKK